MGAQIDIRVRIDTRDTTSTGMRDLGVWLRWSTLRPPFSKIVTRDTSRFLHDPTDLVTIFSTVYSATSRSYVGAYGRAPKTVRFILVLGLKSPPPADTKRSSLSSLLLCVM